MESYGEDLAYIHDDGFGDFARQAAPGLLALLADSGIDGGLVVDLGCGSGIWAELLCEAGYDVLGIDQSAAMIDLASNRAPSAHFEVASIHRSELPTCAAATSIGEGLSYLADPEDSEIDLAGLFRRIYQALLPAGVLIFDVMSTNYQVAPGARTSTRQGDDWSVKADLELAERNLLRREITFSRRIGDSWRSGREVHFVELLDPDLVVASLEGVGFFSRRLEQYGDFDLLAGRAAFLARKSG